MFLTGQDEIESLAKLVTDCAQHCGSGEFNITFTPRIQCESVSVVTLTFEVVDESL